MKKVFTLLITCLLLISNVFGYNDNIHLYENNILTDSKVSNQNNLDLNYLLYALMKYMGFRIPLNSVLNDYSGFGFTSNGEYYENTLLTNVIGGFLKYNTISKYGVGIENVDSDYIINPNNVSSDDILFIEKNIINQLKYYIENNNTLVIFDENNFMFNNLGSFEFEVYDRNITSNSFTPSGSSFLIQNNNLSKTSNKVLAKYQTVVSGGSVLYMPVGVNSSGNVGYTLPILSISGGLGDNHSSNAGTFGYYVVTYSNGSYSLNSISDYMSAINITNNSNGRFISLALDSQVVNNLMYQQFPSNQSNNAQYYFNNNSNKKTLLAYIGDNQNSINYLLFGRNAVISANGLDNKLLYGYYGFGNYNYCNAQMVCEYKDVNLEFKERAIQNDYSIIDIDNFVSNTNIINMSDSDLLDLVPLDENGNLDLSELRTLAPTLNELLNLPNSDLPNYNGGGSGGSDEPTPSTPSDTNLDYGLSDAQVEILNENTALGTIGKILAKGFEFIATPLAKGLQGLNDWFKKLVGATEEAPQTIWNFFSSGFNSLKNGLDSITQSVSNIASDLWSAFQSGFNSISGFIEDVANGLQSQINVLTQGLSNIADAIGNITQDIVTNITNVFSDVVDAINSLALGFWDYFKNGFQWIKDSIDALTSQVINSITNLGSIITDAFNNMWDAFINLFTANDFDTWLSGELSDLQTLASNKWGDNGISSFVYTLKNGLTQSQNLEDLYITLPSMFGGNSTKVTDFTLVRNNIDLIRGAESVVIVGAIVMNGAEMVRKVVRA